MGPVVVVESGSGAINLYNLKAELSSDKAD